MLRRIGVALALVLAICGQTYAADCEDLNQMSPEGLVNFLRTSAKTADQQCVVKAIKGLGASRPKERATIELLIDLLDFREPQPELLRKHFSSSHEPFPAVSALLSVGTPALEPLIARLQSGRMTDTARENAIRLIFFLHTKDPVKAVLLLRKAADRAPTQVAFAELESAARDMAKLCSRNKGRKVNCEAALLGVDQ